MPHFQRSVIIDKVSDRSISEIVRFSSGQQKGTIMAKRKRKVIQIDYADPKKKSDRSITKIDDVGRLVGFLSRDPVRSGESAKA
jgi:hypothetical protein